MYHAELRLQVDLQALKGASEFCDFRFATLQMLCIHGNFTVQLFSLQREKKMIRSLPTRSSSTEHSFWDVPKEDVPC